MHVAPCLNHEIQLSSPSELGVAHLLLHPGTPKTGVRFAMPVFVAQARTASRGDDPFRNLRIPMRVMLAWRICIANREA